MKPTDVLHDAKAQGLEAEQLLKVAAKIACPKCGRGRSIVRNTRPSLAGGVYRRRQCVHCRHRFNTEEHLAPYAAATKTATRPKRQHNI